MHFFLQRQKDVALGWRDGGGERMSRKDSHLHRACPCCCAFQDGLDGCCLPWTVFSHPSGAKMHRFYMLMKAVHRNATRLSVDNMLHRFPFLAATGLHCPRSHAGVALLLSCMLWRRSTRATWQEATDRSGQRRTHLRQTPNMVPQNSWSVSPASVESIFTPRRALTDHVGGRRRRSFPTTQTRI